MTSMYLGLVELNVRETMLMDFGGEKLSRVVALGRKVKEMVGKLVEFEKEEHAMHLEEDLVVEGYVLVSRVIESIVSDIILKRNIIIHKVSP